MNSSDTNNSNLTESTPDAAGSTPVGAGDSSNGTVTSSAERAAPGAAQSDGGAFRLDEFKFESVLRNDSVNKRIALLARHEARADVAVFDLSVESFDDQRVLAAGRLAHSDTVVIANDIYRTFRLKHCLIAPELKLASIYPATDKHIARFKSPTVHIFDETPDFYRMVIEPYVRSHELSVQWVYNILEHKKETERIIYEDTHDWTGFMLLPDMKWVASDLSATNIEQMYLIAIVRRRDLLSIRSLTAEHIPMLLNIRQQSLRIIKEKFGVPSHMVRAFLHYYPSFYHLHIHFMHTRSSYGSLCSAPRSHMLSDVIESLQLDSDYYAKRTLSVAVFRDHRLCDQFLLNHTEPGSGEAPASPSGPQPSPHAAGDDADSPPTKVRKLDNSLLS